MINKVAAKYILNRRYFHRLNGIRSGKKLRRLIALEWVKDRVGDSDTFCATWEQLEAEGLI